MTLEDALREACTRGLTHFTLYPVPSADGKITYWHGRATPSTGHSYVQTHGTDPVDVMTKVLESLPKAPKRPKIDPHRGTRFDEPKLDQAAIERHIGTSVTAAVTDELPEPQTNSQRGIDQWLPRT